MVRTSHEVYRKNAICKDCKIELKNKYALRCKSCNGKYNNSMRGKVGELNPNYKHGLTNNNKCIDCNTRINRSYRRCHSCAAKYFLNDSEFKVKLQKRLSGSNNPMFGKKQSLKSRKLMSLKAGGTGIPYENNEYGSDFDSSLKEQIRFRDKYTCRICGCSQLENGKQLDCHHIDYDKKNNDMSNLITLCHSCHTKTNWQRKIWKEYFNNVKLV